MTKNTGLSIILTSAIIVSCICLGKSHSLHGTSENIYQNGEKVELDVNALRSPNTAIPYGYDFPLFGFCLPQSDEIKIELSFGSRLLGDRVINSDYKLYMRQTDECKVLCTKALNSEQVNFLRERISEKYYVNWLVDSLPALRTTNGVDMIGFLLGSIEGTTTYLYNHHDIVVSYHLNKDGSSSVVGVKVKPSSKLSCNSSESVKLIKDSPVDVIYTYSVTWTEKDEEWATRWDSYVQTYDPKIHWFSLTNSFATTIFLTIIISTMLSRTLYKDVSNHNTKLESLEEVQQDHGWQSVHGDVFRTPQQPCFLSVLIGNGVQILMMCCIILTLAILGFLSPAMRGSLITATVVVYTCLGFVAGFISARLYKMMGGEECKKNVILTAFLIPGSLSLLLIFFNFFLIEKRSSSAVPFGTLTGFLAMWIVISASLSFAGSYFGFKRQKISHPLQVNQIPRTIPRQPFYLQIILSSLLCGILPFSAIFIELYFIMTSIWLNGIYNSFGFLAMVFIIMCLISAQVTIVICYFHLRAEDPRWWWRSFLTSGCSALYLLIYSVFYFSNRLDLVDFVSCLLYFGWAAATCLILFILNGTVGFLACFLFVRIIYSKLALLL